MRLNTMATICLYFGAVWIAVLLSTPLPVVEDIAIASDALLFFEGFSEEGAAFIILETDPESAGAEEVGTGPQAVSQY